MSKQEAFAPPAKRSRQEPGRWTLAMSMRVPKRAAEAAERPREEEENGESTKVRHPNLNVCLAELGEAR